MLKITTYTVRRVRITIEKIINSYLSPSKYLPKIHPTVLINIATCFNLTEGEMAIVKKICDKLYLDFFNNIRFKYFDTYIDGLKKLNNFSEEQNNTLSLFYLIAHLCKLDICLSKPLNYCDLNIISQLLQNISPPSEYIVKSLRVLLLQCCKTCYDNNFILFYKIANKIQLPMLDCKLLPNGTELQKKEIEDDQESDNKILETSFITFVSDFAILFATLKNVIKDYKGMFKIESISYKTPYITANVKFYYINHGENTFNEKENATYTLTIPCKN